MKKWIALILALVCIFSLAGCGRSLNTIIAKEPSITGTVKEVGETSMLIYFENEGYPSGADCWVSLHVENSDGIYSPILVGDEVTVYFDGSIAESYPMQIHNVYAILLTEPADRSVNQNP